MMSLATFEAQLDEAASKAKAAAYPLKFHGDVDDAPLKEWLVNKTIPKVGKGILAGQWGTYKSFLAKDLARGVMTKTPFAGRAVMRQGAVLFVAAEGQDEVRVRLEGIARDKIARIENFRDAKPVDPTRLPFAWIETCPRLTADDAAETLCAIVAEARRALEARFSLPLALVIIDTLMVASQFRDANDAAEAQRVMSVLDAAAREAEAFVLAVDHFGKDVTTGTRNSSAKEGAADAVLALLGDRDIAGNVSNSRLAVRKVRGAPTGEAIPFKMREVIVYENAGYDAVTTLVVDWDEHATTRPADEPARAKRWPRSLAIFKKALDYALTSSGKRMRPFVDGPEVLAAEREAVRAEFMKTYEADNADAKRAAFSRSVKAALAAELMNAREIGDAEAAATFLWPLVQP